MARTTLDAAIEKEARAITLEIEASKVRRKAYNALQAMPNSKTEEIFRNEDYAYRKAIKARQIAEIVLQEEYFKAGFTEKAKERAQAEGVHTPETLHDLAEKFVIAQDALATIASSAWENNNDDPVSVAKTALGVLKGEPVRKDEKAEEAGQVKEEPEKILATEKPTEEVPEESEYKVLPPAETAVEKTPDILVVAAQDDEKAVAVAPQTASDKESSQPDSSVGAKATPMRAPKRLIGNPNIR